MTELISLRNLSAILIFSGIWNLVIAGCALLLPDFFVMLAEFQNAGVAAKSSFKIGWVVVVLVGIGYLVAVFKNSRLRAGIPLKLFSFVGATKLFLAGKAGIAMTVIGIGDFLFIFPFVFFLLATKHYGWL